MKKILLSLALITLTASAGIAATRAYFTDHSSVQGNSISTGLLKVSIKNGGASASPIFDNVKLLPGQTTSKCILIANDGNADFIFRSYIKNVTQKPDDFADKLKVSIKIRPSLTECPFPSGYTEYGPAGGKTLASSQSLSLIINEGVVDDSKTLNNIAAAFEPTPWPLKTGYAAMYKVDVALPFDTPTTYQEAEFKGDIIVDATQSVGQTDAAHIAW